MAGKPSYRTADATVSAYDAEAVTPGDSTELRPTRGLYIGVGGDLAVEMSQGATVTFANVLGGTLLPIQVAKVLATGTTATSIVALY